MERGQAVVSVGIYVNLIIGIARHMNKWKAFMKNPIRNFILLLSLIAMSGQAMLPITFQSSIMVHPETKKSVILFDEAHTAQLTWLIWVATLYDQSFVVDQSFKTLSNLYIDQKSVFTELVHTLLHTDALKGSHALVITETGNNPLCCCVEEEAGAAPVQDNQETLEVLPRLFLQHIFMSGVTIDEKLDLFKQAIEPFNNIPTASFLLQNNVRWVAGDRNRTEKDAYLSHQLREEWQEIVDAINADIALPQDSAELTVEAVKEYAHTLHAEFEQGGIVDTWFQKIVDLIDAALASKKLRMDDHFARLYAYLDSDDARDELNTTMLCFLAQKFDLELRMYLNAFDDDQNMGYAFIQAGAAHNDQMRLFLAQKGYALVEQAGVSVLGDVLLEKNPKIVIDALEVIAAYSPFVHMQKIVETQP